MKDQGIREAILDLLSKSKTKGMLTDSLQSKFGEDVSPEDLQRNLGWLHEEGLIDAMPGNDRLLVAHITHRGEAAARGDWGVSHRYTVSNNTVNVYGSNTGVINQGTVDTLKVTISNLSNEGHESLSKSLAKLMKAVTENNELEVRAREDVLKQLNFLGEQVSAPPAKRNLSLASAAISMILGVLGHSADLLSLWESDLAQPLLTALGLS